MKIICDSCGAKYSIADEKVAGKVFRIKCKKCGSPIVVRGDRSSQVGESSVGQAGGSAGTAEGASRSSSVDAGAVWHVVINGEQQGPYGAETLQGKFDSGEIDLDTYVWREGFDGWKLARDVEEVAELSSENGDAGASASGAGRASRSSLTGNAPASNATGFGGGYGSGASRPSDPGASAQRLSAHEGADLFGQDEATEIADVRRAAPFLASGASPASASPASASPGPADPFGSAGANDASSGRASSAEDPADNEEASMTGARNENSVLFSLSNLKSLATNASSKIPPRSAAARESSTGAAPDDGSGLIDIKTLTGVGGGRDSSAQADDILSMGSAGSPFGGGLGAPVLAPEVEEKGSNKLLMAVIGIGGFLVLAMAVLIIVLLTRDDEPEATAAAPSEAAAPASPSGAADQPSGKDTAEVAADNDGTAAAEPSDVVTEEEAEEEDSGEAKTASSRRTSRSRSRSRSSSSSSKASAPVSSKPKQSAEDRSIADLLDSAAASKGSASSSTSNLPQTPSKSQVRSALSSVRGAVKQCGGGESGVVNTSITVAGSTGRVSNVSVSGKYAGTSVGSCVARAVKRAKFPKFKQSSLKIGFPFSL